MTALASRKKRLPLSYSSYEEAVANYDATERWQLFDGTEQRFNIAHECIDRHVAKGVAVRIKEFDGAVQEHDFSEISTTSAQFANLLSGLSVEKGQRIGIFLEPCIEFYSSFFGTLKSGAVAVVGSRLLGEQSITYRLQNSASCLAVVDDELEQIARTTGVKTVITKTSFLDTIKGESNKYEYSTSSKDVAVIQYTSGTTGMPKPFEYRHKSLVSLAPVARFAYGITDDDSFFCPSPVGWGHGIWGAICAPLMFGVSTATRSGKFVPQYILEAIEEFKANNISMSPSAFRRLLSYEEKSDHGFRIEKISYTGEPMDLSTFSKIRDKFGVDPCCMYGSTEVGVIIANYAGFKNWKVKPGSLGKPMPGLEIAVIDENDNSLPPGAIGHISVRLSENLVRMGDLGSIDQEGFFWYKGRSDEVIKTSGYRVGAEEIESILNTQESVLESAVIGVLDPDFGQRVKAFVKLRENRNPSEELKLQIQNYTGAKLGSHAYPRSIEFVDEIPRTVDGKIKRQELKARDGLRR